MGQGFVLVLGSNSRHPSEDRRGIVDKFNYQPIMKNPPAYPGESWRGNDGYGYFAPHPGMSLLDHFAGLAMQAWITNPHRTPNAFGSGTTQTTIDTLAHNAYKIARAMLEERAKPENQL